MNKKLKIKNDKYFSKISKFLNSKYGTLKNQVKFI